MKTARPVVPSRPPDAALGRETRGLMGPARRGPAQSSNAAPGGPARRPARRRGIGLGLGRGILDRVVFGPLRAIGRIVTPARSAGLLGLLGSGFLFTFVTGPTAFGLTRTEVPALTWTDPAAVVATLDLAPDGNVFRLDTTPLEAALQTLPGIAGAEVSVALPDAVVVVTIEERVPILAWQVGEMRYIAGREGTIFATSSTAEPLPAGVAVIEDRRVGGGAELGIGAKLDAVDLDVATRLGSLDPADIGSVAARLRVAITESDGFIVNAPGAWTAVFGFYSPATRATTMIPGQVRLLRSLLDGREATLARIVLASATDGTFVPKPTTKP